MKKIFFIFITIFLQIPLFSQIERPIGINLAGIQDWSEEFVFVDVFKQSREWIAHDNVGGASWASGVEIPLRPDGYPLEIPFENGVNPPQAIRTLLYFGDLENIYPAGNYRLIASGTGQIRLWGAATGTFQCPVDTLVDVDNSLGGIALEIEISQASDPIHDIHFVMPGFHDTFLNHPFYPDLLSFLNDFQVIRFMDWMKTNNSPVKEWADRNTPSYFSQTLENGVAYEYMVEISNLLQKDLWINIPHQATDNFISQFAQFLRDEVNPDLKIYLEYSNEVWNGIFEQYQYADSMGLALGYSGQPWERGWQFTAKRSADVFRIFENEFADDSRLVKVIPGWAHNAWVTNVIIDYFNNPIYNPTGIDADALAVAPYFAGEVANAIGDAGLANTISVDAILDSMELSLNAAYTAMDESKTVADDHELMLLAYEGGQHLVTSAPYHNNDNFVSKLLDANRHTRMENMYCSYFDHWYETTQGDLFCNFSSHGNYGKWGSWGVKEFMDDTLSPKYQGLLNCVFSYNEISSTTESYPTYNNTITIFPNPSNGNQITIQHQINLPNLDIFDVNGRRVLFKIISKNKNSISIQTFDYQGVAFVVISNKEERYLKKTWINSIKK